MKQDRDLDRLTDEITTLCGHLDAAEYRLLELIRDLDERAPWGEWEVKSCAYWLNWKCGIAMGAAREKVRVARALVDLPLVCEAFREGRLSYSKVRAISRVANEENEAFLVEMALGATAAHIEKIVRQYRQVERIQAVDKDVTRTLSTYWDDDGCLVLKGRLPAEQGALLQLALERADEWLEGDPDESREARGADALTGLAEHFLAVPPSEAESTRTADRFQVTVHVPAGMLRSDAVIDPDDPPMIDDGPVLSPDTVRRIACDAAIVPLVESVRGEPLSIGRKTRVISSALHRALKRRDRGCRFPGCCNTRFVDAHHIEHWADGGETCLDNLVLLCRHHHRLLHEGGYSIEASETTIVFRDRSGFAIPETAERRLRGNVSALFDDHERAGIVIDPDTTTPDWYGERPDYPHILLLLKPYPPDGGAAHP